MKQFPLNYKGWYEKSIESFWCWPKNNVGFKMFIFKFKRKILASKAYICIYIIISHYFLNIQKIMCHLVYWCIMYIFIIKIKVIKLWVIIIMTLKFLIHICKFKKLYHWWWIITFKFLYNSVSIKTHNARVTIFGETFVLNMPFKEHTYCYIIIQYMWYYWLNLIHICKGH
jgi:hypothetical protein